jgi:hypothetical protein
MQYGAIAGTDSTAAINGAITACGQAGGGIVSVPEGEFIASGVLMDQANVVMVGQGASSALVGTDTESSILMTITGSNCEVHGVTFKGDVITEPAGTGQGNDAIHIDAVRTVISQCRFSGTGIIQAFNNGIVTDSNCIDTQITNNYFDRIIGTKSTYGNHIEMLDQNGATVVGNIMTQSSQGFQHVRVAGTSKDVLVSGNVMTGGAGSMIVVATTDAGNPITGVAVRNNIMRAQGGGADGDQAPITLIGFLNNCVVQDNMVTDSGAYGIKVSGAGIADSCCDVLVSGNQVTGAALGGIRARNVDRTQILSNKFHDCGGVGIEVVDLVGAESKDCLIVGNAVTGTTHTYALDLTGSGTGMGVFANKFDVGTSRYFNGVVTGDHVIEANLPSKNNITATANPTASDDVLDGYEVGSHWINVTGNTGHLCVDSSVGAAIWVETTAGAGGGAPDQDLFATVAGDTGSFTADGPTNTLAILGGNGITSVATDAVGTTTVTLDLAEVPYVDFDNTSYPEGSEPARVEGRVWYDATLNALSMYPAGTEVQQTLGHELLATVDNSNGVNVLNGQVVARDGANPGSVVLADASDADLSIHTVGMATELIEIGTRGMATVVGLVNGIDTSAWTSGTVLYLSDTVAGGLTSTAPSSPSYAVRVGTVVDQSATVGSIYISVDNEGNKQATAQFLNGAALEQATTVVSEAGGVVELSYTTDSGSPQQFIFGEELVEVAIPIGVNLVAGTDVAPTTNYVYVPKSTGVLTASVVDFPSGEEFAPIAKVYVQSAASVATDGVLGHHRWQNHLGGDDNNGHLYDIDKWIRSQHATWVSGALGAMTDGLTSYFSMTSGVALQLHENSIVSMDMATGDPVYVVNDSVTPYKRITDLATISLDASGESINNKYMKLVFTAVVNSDSTTTVLVNLPSGSYSANENEAEADPDSKANYSLPASLRGTGILIASCVVKISGGTVTEYGVVDLRGALLGAPTSQGGAGAGTSYSIALYRPKATDYTFTAADSGGYFSNEGAGLTIVTFTLPTNPTVGTHYHVVDANSNEWQITAPAGATILLDGVETGTGGSINNNGASGQNCHILASSATTWVVVQHSIGVERVL